jgi:hypothetical protein
MRRWLYLVRFFLVVPPMPLLMVGAFVVATVVSAVVILVEPTRASGALTPILLLQLFACSSGFDVPARRGHYDLLLTHGEVRRRVIVAHWAASALPGVLCWLLLAIVGYTASSSDSRAALLNSGTLSAVILVSTIPWATTVRLPRFSGAIGWLLIVAMLSLTAPRMLAIDLSVSIEGWTQWLTATWAVLVYPPLLVGHGLGGWGTLVVVPGLLFALGGLLVAFWSVNHRDIPLEAAQ